MDNQNIKGVLLEAILSLPQDMKAVLRIVEDPDLADEQRTLAAAALIHVLSAGNAIPGMRGMLAYVDDVIVLRLVLARLEQQAPEVMAQQREDSPELFDPLEDQLAVIEDYLGELIVVLEKVCDGLPKIAHEGISAGDCASDPDASTWLYDAVHEAIVDDLDFDEDEVRRALRGVDQIRPSLEMRRI